MDPCHRSAARAASRASAFGLFACLLAALPIALPAARAQEPDPGAQAGLLGPGRGLELTLDAAIQIALENNLGLKIDSLASDVALYIARGSWGEFDWVLSARAGISDSRFQGQDIFAGGEEIERDQDEFFVDLTKPLTTGGTFNAHFDSVHTETNSASQLAADSTEDVISLSYIQPLLRGAWRGYATSVQREAEVEYRRVHEFERQSSQNLITDVSNAYWDLVSTREQLEVAESFLELGRKQVDQNQRRLDAGVGTEIEVLQAQSDVATREERRLAAEVRMHAQDDVLKQLLFPGTEERMWETRLYPRTALPAAVTADAAPLWTAALTVALERRSELRQQRYRIDSAGLRHERTRSERKPGLDLELAASSRGFDADASGALQTAFEGDFPTYSAALAFNYPLGNRSARYAEKAAWAELRAARLVYDELESQITGEVREAVRQVVYQAEAVRASQKSLELAQRQLAAEQARDEVGQSTTFQVLEFQQDLAQAMSTERLARVNYAKALVALSAAQGVIGEASR